MEKTPYMISAVERTLRVLECFTPSRPEATLTEIATELGVRKGTVFRFVATLLALGYLELDTRNRRYRLGRKVLALAQVAVGSIDLRRKALPYLRRLYGLVHENVNLSVLDGDEVLFLERFQSPFILSMNIRVGTRLPLHVASMGKVIAAFLPPEEQERLINSISLRKYTGRTIVDPAEFRAELERVRGQGYAMTQGELEGGLIAIAAPVRNWDGTVVAAINVAGPETRLSPAHAQQVVRPLLLATAEEISRALGAPSEPVDELSTLAQNSR